MGRTSEPVPGSGIETFAATSAADIVDGAVTPLKAATAGYHYEITDITISNMHAAQGTRVDILSGATVIWQVPAGALGGGCHHTFGTPLVCGVAEAINLQCGTAGAAVRGSVGGKVVRG